MIPPSYEAVSARPRYSLYSVHKDFNLHSYFNYFIVPNQTSPNPPPSSFQLFLFKLKCIFFFFFLCYSLHSPYSNKVIIFSFPPSFFLSHPNTTVCPRSSDPFCIVSCCIKWVSTLWTSSIFLQIKASWKGGGYCVENDFFNLKIHNLSPPPPILPQKSSGTKIYVLYSCLRRNSKDYLWMYSLVRDVHP